jgi:hypothetical protein
MQKKPNDDPKPNKRNTITLKVAKNWTKRWRKLESKYNSYNECRAFNIPLKDLQEAIDEGAHSVRAYIGVQELTVEGAAVHIEKLLIVGVDKDGKDMISSSNGEDLDAEGGEIFDFSEPCPTTCDDGSPLNG